MPHTAGEKKRAITRLRRISGQAAALEIAIEKGAECAAVLQQLAALRGAVNGLMSEVLEGHLHETLHQMKPSNKPPTTREIHASVDPVMRLVRSYLK